LCDTITPKAFIREDFKVGLSNVILAAIRTACGSNKKAKRY